MKPPPRTLLAALTTAVAAAGCAPAASDPGFRTLATSPAGGPLSPGDLHPPLDGEWTYEITQGHDAGSTLVRRRGPTDRFAASWVEQEDDRRDAYRRLDEAGNLVMPAVVDHADRALTFFKPPLVVAHGSLAPGRLYRQEVAMRVMDARRPGRQIDLGTAVQTIEYADDAILETPMGRLATKRLIMTFTADLAKARAETSATLYVVPGVGPVVVQRREKVTARFLAIQVRDKAQTLVLRSAPLEVPQAP